MELPKVGEVWRFYHFETDSSMSVVFVEPLDFDFRYHSIEDDIRHSFSKATFERDTKLRTAVWTKIDSKVIRLLYGLEEK